MYQIQVWLKVKNDLTCLNDESVNTVLHNY